MKWVYYTNSGSEHPLGILDIEQRYTRTLGEF